MKNNLPTKEANSETPCSCCGRFHRKLTLCRGFWLGSTCLNGYKHYLGDKNPKSAYWHGYSVQFNRVSRMVGDT